MATTACDSLPSNVVTNCGFETGDLTGWTATPPGYEGQYYGVDTFDANVGTYGAYLAGQNSDVFLSQNIPTAAGTSYYFNFSVAHPDVNYTPYTNDFEVLAGGNVLFSESEEVFGFTDYSFAFTATGASTTIAFGAFDPLNFFSLDNVSVFVTPEPSTLALSLPVVLAGAFLFLRRRKAAI
jgi:hypothetical protein